MKILTPPAQFHSQLQRRLGQIISKTEAYFRWLSHGVRPARGPRSRIPLGDIAKANEEIRAELGSEKYSEVAQRLGEWGYVIDRRNMKAYVARCSGFDQRDVEYWQDRAPISTPEVVARVTGQGPPVNVSGEFYQATDYRARFG